MRLPVDLIRFFFSTRKMANIRSDQIKRDSLTYPEATSKLKITVTYFSFELALSVGIQVAPSSLCLSNELIISCSLFSLKLRCLFCIFQLNSAIIKLHEKKVCTLKSRSDTRWLSRHTATHLTLFNPSKNKSQIEIVLRGNLIDTTN